MPHLHFQPFGPLRKATLFLQISDIQAQRKASPFAIIRHKNYLRDQLPEEVWMSKIFDSEEGKAMYSPHGVFLDPGWEGKESFWQSIEVRA